MSHQGDVAMDDAVDDPASEVQAADHDSDNAGVRLAVATFKQAQTEMKVGALWYIISSTWFELFISLVEVLGTDASPEAVQDSLPGPIDNVCLIDTTPTADPLANHASAAEIDLTGEAQAPVPVPVAPGPPLQSDWAVRPKTDLLTNDYTAVCEEQWKLLAAAFGGGPAIARPVTLSPSGQPFITLASIHLRVGLLVDKQPDPAHPMLTLYAPMTTPLSLLRAEAARAIGLADPTAYVFWDYFGDSRHESLDKPHFSTSDLDQAHLQDGQAVMFEKAEDAAAEESLNDRIPSNNCIALTNIFPSSGSHGLRGASLATDSCHEMAGRKPGLTGLTNLGNTCFMNSSLQCLAHTVPLLQSFLSGTYLGDVNEENRLGKGGEVARAFGALIQKLWKGGLSSVAPREFKSVLGKHAAQFQGYEQHDSQELLSYLLDMLHEDINRIKQKPYIEEADNDEASDDVLAGEAWANYRARNDSSIVDHFQGLLKSTLDCPSCGHHKRKFDPFMYLSLPLPGADLQTREFTVVSVDGSQLPMRCAATLSKHCSVSDLLAAAAEVLGLADKDADKDEPCALLAVAITSYSRITVHDPAADLPPAGRNDKVIVYHYPTRESGPLGGGCRTIVWPPSTGVGYGSTATAPLLLWTHPNAVELVEPPALAPNESSYNQRHAVRPECPLFAAVDDALRPFKRHKSRRLSQPLPPASDAPPAAAAGPASAIAARTGLPPPEQGGPASSAHHSSSLHSLVGDDDAAAGMDETATAAGDAGAGMDTASGADAAAGTRDAAVPAADDAAVGMEETGADTDEGTHRGRSSGGAVDMTGGSDADETSRGASGSGEAPPLSGGSASPRDAVTGSASGAAGCLPSSTPAAPGAAAGGAAAAMRDAQSRGQSGAALRGDAGGAAAQSGSAGGGSNGSEGGTFVDQDCSVGAAGGAAERDSAAARGANAAIGSRSSSAMDTRFSGAGAPGIMGSVPAAAPLDMWASDSAPAAAGAAGAESKDAGATAAPPPSDAPFRIVVANEFGTPSSTLPSHLTNEEPQFFKMELTGGTGADALFDLEAMTQPQRHGSCDLVGVTRQHTLDECIQSYLASEVLSQSDAWFCPNCKSHVQAKKALELWRLPEVLVVHLKRFSYSVLGYYSTTSHKLDSLVDFPLQGLDLSGSVRCGSSDELLYDCFAVSNHFGSASGGHYSAYCCEPVAPAPGQQAWHLFDDSTVSPATPGQVVSPAAYVLFYRRRSSSSKDPADLIEQCQQQFVREMGAMKSTQEAATPMETGSLTVSMVAEDPAAEAAQGSERDQNESAHFPRTTSLEDLATSPAGSVADATDTGATPGLLSTRMGSPTGSHLVTSANSEASSHGPIVSKPSDLDAGIWEHEVQRGRGVYDKSSQVKDWLCSDPEASNPPLDIDLSSDCDVPPPA